MTDRIGLDSTSWQAVIAAVKARQTFRGLPVSMALGYLDGAFAWPQQAWAELAALGIKGRAQVGYTVTGSGGEAMRARAGDAEPGDMDPAKAAKWAHDEHLVHHYPAPYCSRSWKPLVVAECHKLGLVLGQDYGLIVATLDGTFTDSDGSDLRTQNGVLAIQYEQANSPIHQAGQPPDLDVTLIVSPNWRRPPTSPAPSPPPPVVQLDGVVVVLPKGTSRGVISTDGGKTWR